MRTIIKTQSTITTPRTRRVRQDEAAIVRIGRLANAIAFAKYAYTEKYRDEDEMTRRRQVYQSMYLLGGYLFEAMRLVDELSTRYGNRPYFAELLVFGAATAKDREIFTEFIFSPGFHLESSAKATEDALNTQELELNSVLACCSYSEENEAYFHSVFAFDTQRLVEALEKNYSYEQLYEFTLSTMPQIAERFLDGASQFIKGVAEQVSKTRNRSVS